jgi:putative ABC transport system permease protein
MAVNKKFADDRGWKVGDKVPVYFGATGAQELEVGLIFEKSIGQGNIWLPLETFNANVLPTFKVDSQIYVTAKDAASVKPLRAQLDGIVADSPTVQVQDLQQYITSQTGPIDTFLAIIYGLLGLAIIIALIGIANTLSLSVLERTRELGLLRAVGMTRRQLRRTVRTEAAIIAISADTPGIFTYNLPVAQLVIICLVAGFAGVLAALLPARRAANLDVLKAISSE